MQIVCWLHLTDNLSWKDILRYALNGNAPYKLKVAATIAEHQLPDDTMSPAGEQRRYGADHVFLVVA